MKTGRKRAPPKPWLVDGIDGRVALSRIEREWLAKRRAQRLGNRVVPNG